MTIGVPEGKSHRNNDREEKGTNLSQAEVDQNTFSQVRIIQEITVEGVSQLR